MMKDEEKLVNVNREFSAEDFTLVNKDLTSKIHDEKFKTKATTFGRDAFKRFCKNKSSVVAAVIIGLMLIGSFLIPAVSNEKFDPIQATYQAKMPPKLFPAGTGGWDGTATYKDQILDRRKVGEGGHLLPAGGPDEKQGFKEKAIVSMTTRDIEYLDITQSSEYAYGGYLFLENSNPLTLDDDPYKNLLFIQNYYAFDLSEEDEEGKDSNINLSVIFGLDDHITNDSRLVEQYRIVLYSDKTEKLILTDYFIVPTEEGEYDPITCTQRLENGIRINLSDVVRREIDKIRNDASLTDKQKETRIKNLKKDLEKSKVRIQGLPKFYDEKTYNYMLVKSVGFTFDETVISEENLYRLETISFRDRTDEEVIEAYKEGITISDANAVSRYGVDSQGVAPDGYWQSNCARLSYKSEVRYVDVVYDMYEHVFGERTMNIGHTDLQKYIDDGLCRLEGLDPKIPLESYTNASDIDINVNKLVILDEDCPIIELNSVKFDKTTDSSGKIYVAWTFNADVLYYRYLGLSSMPQFIFGTDSNGFDLLTRCFSSLKVSLLVAIICVAICLAIGLVWGAISGYFGGTVDLAMERVTDIISGLPSIILMTLLLTIMGRNIYTFAFSIILTGWIGTASLTRTQFYRFRDREYVLASRTLGASDARLIFKHILPNGLGTIITSSVLRVPSFIATEATIAYLGIGINSKDSFGVILQSNQQFIDTFPHLIILPALMLALLMISFNLFGNGLRDAVNPTLKGGE